MDGLSYTVDMSDVVTRIVPVAYNGRTMSGDTPWVDSDNINKYAKKYIREVKFEDVKLAEDASDGEEDDIIICADQAALDAALTKKCEDMYAAGADLPAVTIEVTMIDLSKTEQYKDFADLVSVGLGDTVHCYNYKLGITTDARVIKLTWDCITNRSAGMTLGDYEYNYFSDLTSTMESVSQIIGPGNTVIAEKVKGIINGVNTQMRAQTSAAKKQDVRAIIFEDLDPKSPNYGAMCLGTMGFQIASKRTADGRDWDWSTFGTGQGFFADFMVAGTMLADRIKGGTLILGGEENGDGMARVLDGDGNIIIQLDNNGFKCNGTGVYSDRYIRVIDGMIGFGSDKEENQYLLWAYPSVGFCLYKAKKDGTILDSIMRIDDESIYFDVDKIGPKGVPGATGRAEFSNGTYLEFKNGFLVGGNTIEGAF